MDKADLLGGFAAVCTTASYFPQLKKCWDTGETGDLSLRMLLILIAGLSTWIIYGFVRSDIAIIVANSISVCSLLGILGFKLREIRRSGRKMSS